MNLVGGLVYDVRNAVMSIRDSAIGKQMTSTMIVSTSAMYAANKQIITVCRGSANKHGMNTDIWVMVSN